MDRSTVMARIGAVVAAIGSDGLAPALAQLLQAVAPYTFTVVFGYWLLNDLNEFITLP